MLRETVKQVFEAASKIRMAPKILQLAPVCSFNAFEIAYPEIFNNEAFLLFDMGHLQSTVLVGSRGELVLVPHRGRGKSADRSADGGGRNRRNRFGR